MLSPISFLPPSRFLTPFIQDIWNACSFTAYATLELHAMIVLFEAPFITRALAALSLVRRRTCRVCEHPNGPVRELQRPDGTCDRGFRAPQRGHRGVVRSFLIRPHLIRSSRLLERRSTTTTSLMAARGCPPRAGPKYWKNNAIERNGRRSLCSKALTMSENREFWYHVVSSVCWNAFGKERILYMPFFYDVVLSACYGSWLVGAPSTFRPVPHVFRRFQNP
jgi:hypothetical protein